MTLRRAGSLGHSARGEAPRGFRPDIQGLRAFAVLAVVAEHVTGRPSGGFVGVDIFFVISGFLITGILAREFANTGTISFSDFYRRRIKRIVPAATLTLVGTVIVGAFLLTRERAVLPCGTLYRPSSSCRTGASRSQEPTTSLVEG